MRAMLDTNAYSAFKRGEKAILELLARTDEILVPVPVLAELRAGFRYGNREEENINELLEFLSGPRIRIHQLDEGTAVYYAEIHAELRSAGKPIPINDLWIASAARESGSILVSKGSHFDAVPGLIRRCSPIV